MPSHSALARLQQATTLSLLLLAAAWAVSNAATPLRAAVGAALILFFYSIVLAAEFLLLRHAARNDAVPRATWGQLLRAWWNETCEVPRVFCWRQPFRWRQEADHVEPDMQGRRGVVFIHGFVCNRGFWTPWLKRLRAQGIPSIAVNLEPVFGSIDDYVPIVDAAVRRMTDATGHPPLVVCHSMGGLAARAWLRAARDPGRVHHVVTIGTPHHGTWLARFSQLTNGHQMRIDGPWLRQLHHDEAGQPAPPFTCWYSNCDNIVFPPSTATLPGADNRLVPGAAHVDLGFRAEVVESTLAHL